ncbi:hypothetical protein ONZ45_g12685 [Pleurotus djamor]|nr:hypothetical protein ONZ45_g12685 [Pleurotus djamor]
MSSYDKVVKLACKPKAAPPKAKYLDTIIAATWSEDGAVHDVCKALSPRFREPNVIVVFKALIVLHTMMRNGSTDNVLSYLSSSEVLRLRNISSATWEGYSTPQNLQNYAIYLDARIRAYRDLKHDAIRVQAESNRDMRNSNSIEADTLKARKASAPSTTAPVRSKTIMGRKLRVMTVEKGLLRETKAVHRMIDTLLECRFYLDDLEDELVITALRMLVKDLLILFQAGNEGVINVLEHYFEMSHIDAKEALGIYRHFCNQTERVVEYLGVARKLQNLLNVPIPNLKHAPVSLAGALQEYLDDPNFEQNRLEYKANKPTGDKPNGKNSSKTQSKATAPSSSTMAPPPAKVEVEPPKESTSASASSSKTPNIAVDFFSSIEEQQPNMFNPQTNSPNNAYFQQQASVNPFQQQMMTGQPFGNQPTMQSQPTGFPQSFSMNSTNPFGLVASQSLQPQPTATPAAPGHRPFSSYIQPQATSFMQSQPPFPAFQPQPTGFLQPQATGSNPFRQSMLVPQTTGMALFGVGNQPALPSFPSSAGPSSGPSFNQSPFPMTASTSFPLAQPPAAQPTTSNGITVPARPASTPLTSFGMGSTRTASPPVAQPVKTHQTGTKNPFGPIITPAPPVPKQPTLMELAMGKVNAATASTAPWPAPQAEGQQRHTATGSTGQSLFGSSSALAPGATDMSGVASSFSFTKPPVASGSSVSGINGLPSTTQGLISQDTSTTISSSAFSSSSLFSQPTGTTVTSSAPSISSTTPFSPSSALKPQTTGISGLKPFKPTSSFGASLLEALPPIPGSSPNTPAVTGTPTAGTSAGNNALPAFNPSSTAAPSSASLSSPTNTTPGLSNQPNGFGNMNRLSSFGALNSQPTGTFNPSFPGATGTFGSGSSLGSGLRPQMTGGAANPFRASMAFGSSPVPPVPPLPTGMGASLFGNTANGSMGTGFGASAFGQNGFNPSTPAAFGNPQTQPQQNASLI